VKKSLGKLITTYVIPGWPEGPGPAPGLWWRRPVGLKPGGKKTSRCLALMDLCSWVPGSRALPPPGNVGLSGFLHELGGAA
jgi:hypothetical protein